MIKFSFPQKIVSVPNISQFDTISGAWDYAVRVCLRMSQRFLILGPSDTELDNKLADEIYKESKRLIPHSDEDIRRFESLHCKLIEKRLAEQPSNFNMVVSRPSLSLLYDAIVCSVMADICYYYPSSAPDEVKKQREVAHMIYIHYKDLLIDERAKVTSLTWLEILGDHLSFGPNAAAKRHAGEIRGGSLSRRQIKTKAPEIITRELDSLKCNTDYLYIFTKYEQQIKRHPYWSRRVLDLFDMDQYLVYGQKRNYEYAWVVHNKKSSSSYGSRNPSDYFKEGRKASFYSRNSKSGWCPISPYQQLTEVSVDDNKLQGMS